MWNIAWRVAYMGGTCDGSVPLYLTRNSSEWSCWLKLIKGKQCITAVHLFYNQLCLGGKSAMQWRWRVGTSRQVGMKGKRWAEHARGDIEGEETELLWWVEAQKAAEEVMRRKHEGPREMDWPCELTQNVLSTCNIKFESPSSPRFK